MNMCRFFRIFFSKSSAKAYNDAPNRRLRRSKHLEFQVMSVVVSLSTHTFKMDKFFKICLICIQKSSLKELFKALDSNFPHFYYKTCKTEWCHEKSEWHYENPEWHHENPESCLKNRNCNNFLQLMYQHEYFSQLFKKFKKFSNYERKLLLITLCVHVYAISNSVKIKTRRTTTCTFRQRSGYYLGMLDRILSC